jgi:hypothetical protein
MEKQFKLRVEITPDEARAVAKWCKKTLPSGFLPEDPRPAWDRVQRQLTYEGIVCRRYKRENAENQFSVLDAFQTKEWPHSIDSPFKLLDLTLRQTIFELNRGLEEASPIGFRVEKRRPAWYLR